MVSEAKGERQNHAADRKSTRLNSSHLVISYAVFCLKKKRCRPTVGLEAVLPPGTHRAGREPDGRRRLYRFPHAVGLEPVLQPGTPPFFFFKNARPPEFYPLPHPRPLPH